MKEFWDRGRRDALSRMVKVGMSNAEIAAVLGCRPNSIRRRRRLMGLGHAVSDLDQLFKGLEPETYEYFDACATQMRTTPEKVMAEILTLVARADLVDSIFKTKVFR